MGAEMLLRPCIDVTNAMERIIAVIYIEVDSISFTTLLSATANSIFKLHFKKGDKYYSNNIVVT